MKKTIKLVTKATVLSLVISGGAAFAASGEDVTYQNITVEKGRLYQTDGFVNGQWALDAGSDGLWFVPKEADLTGTYSAPLKVRHDALANTLVIGTNDDTNVTNGYVGIGTEAPQANLDVQWEGASDQYLHQGLALSANNTNTTKNSEVGFSLINTRDNLRWDFRLNDNGDSFSATKRNTGGNEFNVYNNTTSYTNARVKMGGVTVFENGHLVTASSRELKTNIKSLDTQAARDAFHKLQPVSYEYKTQKGENVVGFIAEDIPDLVAMPSRHTLDATEIVAVLTKVMQEQDKQIKLQAGKIEKLERMQKRLAKLETLLTNLALDTSKSTKEKVTLNK